MPRTTKTEREAATLSRKANPARKTTERETTTLPRKTEPPGGTAEETAADHTAANEYLTVIRR